MNKSHRSVWNESLGAWVAASELTAARGKSNKAGRVALATAVALAALAAGTAQAQTAGNPGEAHYLSSNDAGRAGGNFNNDGATGNLATAIGVNAQAAGVGAVATGLDSKAAGEHSVGIGNASNGAGRAAVSIGEQSAATGNLATGIGPGARASGNAAIAVGPAASASRTHAIAVGNVARSNGVGAVAVGMQSSANVDNGVALGAFSVADRNAGVAGYVPTASDASQAAAIAATQGTLGAVSVGNAANGQLRQVTGVAAGSEATDAVNVAQLNALNAAMLAGQTHYVSVNDGGVPGGNFNNDGATGHLATAIGVNSTATGVAGTAVGLDASASGAQSTAIGTAAQASGQGATALGQQSVASGDMATGVGSGAQALGNASIAVGPKATASGTHSIALGNKAQSDAAGGTAIGQQARVEASDGVALGAFSVADRTAGVAGYVPDAADDAQRASINATQGTLGAVAVGDASTGQFRQITGVAAGTEDSDAVNVSQLKATNQVVSNIQNGGGIKYFHANSAAADSQAIGAESVAVGPQTTVHAANGVGVGNGARVQQGAAGGVALGSGAQVSQAGGVALGEGAVAQTAPGAAGYVPDTATGEQRQAILATTGTQGAVSVGDAANGQFRQINGVAAGTRDSDAANVSQLKGVQAVVTNIDENVIKYQKNDDGTTNYNDATLQGEGGTAIHNLAPGVKGNDAVNVNQLNSGVAGANAYTDARVNQLGADLDKVASNAYAGVASAMAIQMPGTYAPGKTVMRVGTAVFKGETAVGVSFRRTAENNGWSLTGGVGVSRAGAAATVGAEWVFN